MLWKRVAAWAAVRLSMEEPLALLWTLLKSAPLGLPLCSCETNSITVIIINTVRKYRILQGCNNFNFYS